MIIKHKLVIKQFIFFILFVTISILNFAIPEGIKLNDSEINILPAVNKTRAIISSFDPNEADGFIIQDSGSNSGNIIVNKKNLVTGSNSIEPKTLTVGGNANNAFGYNPKDDYIYGIQRINKPFGSNHEYKLVKIGREGTTVGFSVEAITGINSRESIFVGDFDKEGNMYVTGDNNIYKIAILDNGTGIATPIGSRESNRFADWGYTEIDGKERFYYILNDGSLKYYEKSGTILTEPTLVTTGLATDQGTVVAIFMAGTNMFYNPSGTNKIYKVDLTASNPVSTHFTTLDNQTSSGDGARNYLQLIPDLAVGKDILNGTVGENGEKIFSQGEEVSYRLVIKNSGSYPLGIDNISKYTISDKIDLSKVNNVATNVIAKKFNQLTEGIGTSIQGFPTELIYDSSGEFKLSSDLNQLPRLDVGERLEIEYNLAIKLYSFSGDTDQIKNTIVGTIPNKEVTSESQATVTILKPEVVVSKISDKEGMIVQSGDTIKY
uniref:DUF6923 family protein n=1 Tax=Cetobacterium sp. ZOR0034 TaxID=1339239 RepID=UPI000645E096